MKTRLIGLILGVFTFFAYLLVAELGMQAHRFYLNAKYGKPNAEAFLHEHDPFLGWKNKKNASASFVSQEDRVKTQIQINSKGLRGPEYDYPKPAGTKRVLLLGDSMLAGFEVNSGQTVSEKLESMLNQNGEWQVLNGGVRGYGTDQSYVFLMQEGIRYQPDFVIYVFVLNDLGNNLTIHGEGKVYGKSYFEIDANGDLQLRGIPVPVSFHSNETSKMTHPIAQAYMNSISDQGASGDSPKASILNRIKLFLSRHSLLYRYATNQIKQVEYLKVFFRRLGLMSSPETRQPPPEMNQAAWELLEKIVKGMRNFSETHDAKFAVFEAVGGDRHARPMKELKDLTDRLGVPLIESFEPSLKNKRGGGFHIRDQIHWNEKGHAKSAELMYRFLSSEDRKAQNLRPSGS